LEVRDQLLHLVRLQQLALEIQAGHETIDGAPSKLESIENRFRERNAEYVAVKERCDALETDRRTRSGDLQLLEQQRDKYRNDLTKVTNEREYAALLKEIDAVNARISENEGAILQDMEEIESAKQELASREEHIQAERIKVGEESSQVAAAVQAARETIARLEAERSELEVGLPRSLVASIRRLESGRSGVFLARAEDGVCQSCYVRMRPQVYQEIRTAQEIHYCGSCKRLLYHPPSLERAAKQAATAGPQSEPGGVEALNG
jgi:predicted  nucleic acid-binding Zn-ribbon protein